MTSPNTIYQWLAVIGLMIAAPSSFAQKTPESAPTPPASTSPQADDIRPIREAVSIPEPEVSSLPQTLALGIGSIVAIAAFIALILWLKRRAASRRIPNLQKKAMTALEKANNMMADNRSRDYSIYVSDIVRKFIEGRFQLPITQRTTQEFIRELADSNNTELDPYRQTLNEFLNQCDIGKFSGDNLTIDDMQKIHDAALDVVQCEPTANESTQ